MKNDCNVASKLLDKTGGGTETYLSNEVPPVYCLSREPIIVFVGSYASDVSSVTPVNVCSTATFIFLFYLLCCYAFN